MLEQEKKELLELVEKSSSSTMRTASECAALLKLKAKIEAIPTDEPKTENIAKAIELLKAEINK